MAIPGYEDIMLPLLQLSADGEVHSIREIKDVLSQHFELTEPELSHLLPSGRQTTFHNRVGWAKTYLVRAGLLEKPRRGHFTFAQRGREVLENPPERIDNKFLSRCPEFLEFKRKSNANDKPSGAIDADDIDDRKTPEEALQAAYKRLHDDLAGEILGQIKGMSPQFFERLVLDLMLAMGYGGPQNTATVTGPGSDEGIAIEPRGKGIRQGC